MTWTPNYKWYITSDFYIAQNAKCASSSIAMAVLQTYYPDVWSILSASSFPAGQSASTALWQGQTPKTNALMLGIYPSDLVIPEMPDKPVLAVIRDPVQRFISAMSMVEVLAAYGNPSVDDAIAQLQAGDGIAQNFHFWPQNGYAITVNGVAPQLFKFPDELQAFATAAGLSWPLPTINEARNPKPTLTDAQISAVQAYYADDLTLFNGLT